LPRATRLPTISSALTIGRSQRQTDRSSEQAGAAGATNGPLSAGPRAEIREGDFLAMLGSLVERRVHGLDDQAKGDVLIALGERLRGAARGAECHVIPFVPGHRPTDEAAHTWMGSSDAAALILDQPAWGNTAYVLFAVKGVDAARVEVDLTLSIAGPDGSIDAEPIPGWHRRIVSPLAFKAGAGRTPQITQAGLRVDDAERLVVALSPERDLLPGGDWSWEELDPAIRSMATDAGDPFTFGSLFSQHALIDLRLTDGGIPIAGASARLLVCDGRRLGSLYMRLITRLIGPDTARQAAAAGSADPGRRFHPFYPVLHIGAAKAALYERGLAGDIVHKRSNFADPGWLLRIGLYLEFLTVLGLVEAVRDDFGDLLTPAERAAFERGPAFAEIRKRIDPAAWREVWKLREIAFPRLGKPRTGPVAAANLLVKRRATMAFLEAHHEDLKQAIELAGANHRDAQETWQRVFRDAERAVLGGSAAAFPELEHLPERVRQFLLWHWRGQLGLERALRVPGPLAGLLGDQDGLYASACVQYRRSMNAVAAWAKQRGLMDYTGAECVPRHVSLLETKVSRPAQVALLQRRDGYRERLDVTVELPEEFERSAEEVARLLAAAPVFATLTDAELEELAHGAKPFSLGPMERLLVQGQLGSSLFIVVEGEVEVILRREDGEDVLIDTMGKGAVVGELALLTGEPRTATVRAVGAATAYEIGRHQYVRLIEARPALLDELAQMVERRLRARAVRLRSYDADKERGAVRERIRRFVVGD
jgi:CRP-like cAMP-binding protein